MSRIFPSAMSDEFRRTVPHVPGPGQAPLHGQGPQVVVRGPDGPVTYAVHPSQPGLPAPAMAQAPQAPVPSSPRFEAHSGTVIDGRYLVEHVLGEGGMGVVYAGRHRSLDKRVAVKVLKRELADDRDMLERFFNEARAASSIGSLHIVDISDFGMLPDGAAYFVMEFLEGKSLGGLMDELSIVPTPRLVAICKQIAQGLSAAHAAGIVHRDLKPDNIMLIRRGADSDFVKILDFGIAKVTNAASRLTRTGSVFGTPHYMSPEQAAGLPVDSRGDIYALGIILYEMACGKVPFDSDNYMGILTQHMYKAPPPPRTLVVPPNAVSPGLEAIILKCLTKKPEGRYQTMDEVIVDFDLLLAGSTPGAVGELMARSGNYNVPADYFHDRPGAVAAHSPNTLSAIPGVAASRRRAGVLVGIGAGILLSAIAVFVYVAREKPSRGAETPLASSSSSVSLTAATQPEPPRLVPITTATASAIPAIRTVSVVLSPPDAKVALPGGAAAKVEKGVSKIEIPSGEKVTVTVTRSGYHPSQVVLGAGSSDVERVDLVSLSKPAPQATAPVVTTAATTTAAPTAAPPPTTPKPPTRTRPTWCDEVRDRGELYPQCK